MIDGCFPLSSTASPERPKVQIKLTEAAGLPMLAMLERGEFHLGITTIRALQRDSDAFDRVELPPIEFLAASHHSVMLEKPATSTSRTLRAIPLLLESSFFVRHDLRRRVPPRRPEAQHLHRKPHAPYAAGAGRGRHGVAVVPSVLPTHRYRLRIARIIHRRRPLRLPLDAIWDKRRLLPPYARLFCESLAAHMREVFPISKPAPSRRAT